jgi:hypothetical protein
VNKKQNWLELAEFFSVGSFFFGVVITAITKQMLFSLTPLTLVVFFNAVNRQKHNYQPDLYLQQIEYTKELYKDLITFSDDYKYQKLELEKLIEEAKKQRLEPEKEAKLIQSVENLQININQVSQIQESINTIENRLEKIENNQSYYDYIQDRYYKANTQETNKKRENNESDFDNRTNNNYNKRKTQKTNDVDKFNDDMEKLTKGLEKFCQGWGDWGK